MREVNGVIISLEVVFAVMLFAAIVFWAIAIACNKQGRRKILQKMLDYYAFPGIAGAMIGILFSVILQGENPILLVLACFCSYVGVFMALSAPALWVLTLSKNLDFCFEKIEDTILIKE